MHRLYIAVKMSIFWVKAVESVNMMAEYVLKKNYLENHEIDIYVYLSPIG